MSLIANMENLWRRILHWNSFILKGTKLCPGRVIKKKKKKIGVGMCPPGFQSQGLRNWIFGAWKWSLWNEFSLKFVSQELKFSPKSAKFFPQVGLKKLEKGLKWWVPPELKMAWKGGSWGRHIPVLPVIVFPPHSPSPCIYAPTF